MEDRGEGSGSGSSTTVGTADIEADVLVVGGSMIGLSTSMFLAQRGVDVVCVERHAGTAIHPRAGHFHLRTLELMRFAGIEERVRTASLELYEPDGGLVNLETLTGREIATYFSNINAGVEDVSPSRRLFMPQQVLEPILLDRATELGARTIYSTELVDHVQDEHHVTARVRDLDRDVERNVRARYMVACDGNRSPVRERLGIVMRGRGLLSRSITIYFRADCSRALAGRNLGVIYITNETLRGFFRLEKSGMGGFLVVFTTGDPSDPDRFVADSITPAGAVQLVRDAIGDQELEVDVLAVDSWRAVADNAERYREGRILLAGDAAHTMPPNGGFGGNTGVQDAHNLAWKLDLVLAGRAGPRLLDTYDAERRPAGGHAVEQAYARYVLRSDPTLGADDIQSPVSDMHIEFPRYRSAAIVPDAGYDDDGAISIDPRESLGLAGTRAPHVELHRGDDRISTIDLYSGNFVVMAGADGHAWRTATEAAADQLGIPIDHHLVGPGGDVDVATDASFTDAYGIGSSGATLVRPDGYVAWRCQDDTSTSELAGALRHVLDRS